jgi:hypothetical protein
MSSKTHFLRRFAKIAATMVAAFVAASSLANPAVAGDQRTWTEQGLRFLHGEGVQADVDRAVVYLCAASRHGSGPAAFELAWLYFHGRQVQRDDALAAAWFEQARKKGQVVPPRVAEMLEAVKPAAKRCVASHGEDLQINDRRRARLAVAIYDLAPQFELDPALVLEVVRAESNFNPRARSHKGALGLMQLIPATARRFGVDDPLEPMQNLKGGMAYLRWLHERFDGDLALTLAGYNAGEHAVERHGGVPPYAETQEYVKRILRRYGAENFG